jgi:hypothetical protein
VLQAPSKPQDTPTPPSASHDFKVWGKDGNLSSAHKRSMTCIATNAGCSHPLDFIHAIEIGEKICQPNAMAVSGEIPVCPGRFYWILPACLTLLSITFGLPAAR